MDSMRGRTMLTVYRAVIGVLTLVAIGVQFAAAIQKPEFQPGNFFGYFTILSNIFAASVLVFAATRTRKPSHTLDVVRGAATLCLTVVGIIFTLLLANLESNVIAWVNFVVHYLMPVAIVADWIIDPPHLRLTAREALLWLLIPLAYLAYTLIRGSIVHWYPYPFLNVNMIGSATVAAYVAGTFVLTSILAAIVLVVGNTLRIRRDVSLRPSA